MDSRTKNYIVMYCLVIAFVASLANIRVVNRIKENKENQVVDEKTRDWMRFVLPGIAISTFFVGCYFSAVIVAEGEQTGKDKFTGIYYLTVIGIILVILNMSVLSQASVQRYIKGKKFSIYGMIMTLGVGAIIFGFIDNFGMKLGTDAMDDTFLRAFLGPFSVDNRFTKYQPNITKNLTIMNNWVSNDWRKVMNHTLRFKDEINKNPTLKDLSNAIKSFDCPKLDIPATILKDRSLTNDYVDNLRTKFDLIDGSKAMMGNTFSDCIGACLGAGIISLFIYMTCYDGTVVSKDTEEHFLVKYISYYAPIMEAVCIALGCLVPVFLNIAMANMAGNKNSFWCWLIVGVVSSFVIVVMYLSTTLATDMTLEDKKYSVKKTLEGLTERIDLTDDHGEEESQFYQKVSTFIKGIDV